MKIEIEITPEIEEYIKHIPQRIITVGEEQIIKAIQKAKKQLVIEPNIWNCQLQQINNCLLLHDKINEVIGWINNHDRN